MATITFNGPAKTVTLGWDGPITEVDAFAIYSRWKEWVLAGNAQYQPAFAESVGGNELGGGVALSGYYFIRNDLGWRLIPEDGHDYQLLVSGDLYPQDSLTSFVTPPAGDYTVLFTFQRSAASMVVAGGGGGAAPADVADAVWNRSRDAHQSAATMGGVLRFVGLWQRNKVVTDPVAGTVTVYDEDGVTPLFTGDLFEDAAGTQPYRGQGTERRERLT